jgi:hypothetical protein
MSALPSVSEINLFCYCQGIIHFDTEICNNLGVTEQKLNGPEVARASSRSELSSCVGASVFRIVLSPIQRSQSTRKRGARIAAW